MKVYIGPSALFLTPVTNVKSLNRNLIRELLHRLSKIEHACIGIIKNHGSNEYEEDLAFKLLRSQSLIKLLKGVVYGTAKPKFRKARVFA